MCLLLHIIDFISRSLCTSCYGGHKICILPSLPTAIIIVEQADVASTSTAVDAIIATAIIANEQAMSNVSTVAVKPNGVAWKIPIQWS